MNQFSKIELQVEQSTAAALTDPHRRAAISRLVDRLVRPGIDNELTTLLERVAAEAAASGLTPADTELEPAQTATTISPQHVRLTREGVLQTVHIPHALELPGTEAIITQQGDRLIIEPIRKRGLAALLDSWEDLDEDFPEIADPPPEPVDIS